MIRAIIFDLDNCLAPADEPGPQLLEPTFEAIRRANDGVLPNDELEAALAECWRHPLDWVARTHGFSDAMLRAGWEVNRTAEVDTPMRGYGDLDALEHLPVPLFLVTSGFGRLQASKVRALGVARVFAGIEIDAIDDPGRKGKEGLFREIVARGGYAPGEVLVVGDSADSELAAGRHLGMPTVQILRPGVPRAAGATHYVGSLAELPALLGRR